MEKQKAQIISYHGESKNMCIAVVAEETFVVAWALICKREDISELGCLMVSAITHLNGYRVLVSRRESRGKGQLD